MTETNPVASRMSSSDKPGSSSSYGKSCVNCVRSKTKCIASEDAAGKCERCLRLSKDCQQAPTVRKKRVTKRSVVPVTSVATRTTALEERLDDIIHLLHAREPQQLNQNSADLPRILSSSAVNHGDSPCQQYGDRQLAPIEPPTPATSITSATRDFTARPVPSDYPLETEDELDEYLETYRSKMVPFFPIVVIGQDVTVNQIRSNRPFLWLVIRAICSKNSARQHALWQEIRKELARQMLIEGIRSMDLLLGTLVFTAWAHFCLYRKNMITSDIQLAVALAYDLGLMKPAHAEPVMLNYNAQGCPKPPHNSTRTLEERRAVLGLFMTSSTVANYFQRIEPIRWTPYLDQCLQILESSKEYPTDALLVQLVRLQLLRNRVGNVQIFHNCPEGSSGQPIPQDVYIQALKSQLEDLQRATPPELASNTVIQLYILNATVCIHEMSLTVIPTQSSGLDPTVPLQRVENLWTCLAAVKSWFNTFWDQSLFPLAGMPHLSMAIFAQAAHCMVALFRLSTFEAEGVPWDRARVRREMEFGKAMTTWMETWRRIPDAAGLDIDMSSETADGPWAHSNRLIMGVVTWWETKVLPKLEAEANGVDAQQQDQQQSAEGGGIERTGPQSLGLMDGIGGFDGVDMDYLNDDWMRDVLGSGYEFFREPFAA